MTSSVNPVPRKKVAIVGGGSAGIAALWALNRTHHDVYLYEASNRLGGQTNTVGWKKGRYHTLVDIAFTVLNTAASPNFLNFLRKVNVPTVETSVTFGYSRDKGRFEWTNNSLDGIFCQRINLLSPRMWRLAFDIIRFKKFAIDLLRVGEPGPDERPVHVDTLKDFLEKQGYSDIFAERYLIPIAATLWGTDPNDCALLLPIVMLVRTMQDHGLLSTISTTPKWLVLANGAKSYVDAVMRGFPPNHLFLNATVKQVSNDDDARVWLQLEDGRLDVYDHVILATQGDQAFQIIGSSATPEEKLIMSVFRTTENLCTLHSDVSLMPKSRRAWSSHNYLAFSSPWTGKDIDRVSVTYDMNTLQNIPREPFGNVLVTLNAMRTPMAGTIQGEYHYSYPIYTPAAVQALKRLPRIQNKRGISYAGAWTGRGLHEDGFSSGLHVAISHLGARVPFDFVDPGSDRGVLPEPGLVGWVVRIIISLIQAEALTRSAGDESSQPSQPPHDMNTLPRIAWGVSPSRLSAWACASCRRELARTARRPISGTAKARQQQAQLPSMDRLREHYRFKNRTTMYYTLSIILGTVAFSYGSVPMYKMICQTTGWGGQPVRAPGHGGDSSDEAQAARLVPVRDARRIRVTFNASVSDVLPWKFVPQQREVRVLPGETALAFYTATNRGDSDIIGVATYSVTPAQVAPYFSKIQCFCFEEQRLAAGETVDMPVFFYLDPDLLHDLNMRGINEVTLSYTFFKAKYDNNGKFKNIPAT
ncbi:amine oxidase [Xylaria palmicola]|nr:amine oxidase [Xylaria palmicola]